jgi:hypothetical protein
MFHQHGSDDDERAERYRRRRRRSLLFAAAMARAQTALPPDDLLYEFAFDDDSNFSISGSDDPEAAYWSDQIS